MAPRWLPARLACTRLPSRFPPPSPMATGPYRHCRSNISSLSPSSVELQGATLDEFSKLLLAVLDRPVINKTGITGRFDIHVEFSREGTKMAGMPLMRDGIPAPASDPTGAPSILLLQEQLGLRLEQAKGPVEMFVIDHIERPTGTSISATDAHLVSVRI
jgi:uncharacterized protein (TIGR03435 family)